MKCKVISLVIAVLLVGGIAFGQAKGAEGDGVCSSFESFAATVMEKRQGGVRMQVMMEIVNSGEASPQLTEVMRGIVINAYEQPNWNSKEMERGAVREFRNEVYLECIKNIE